MTASSKTSKMFSADFTVGGVRRAVELPEHVSVDEVAAMLAPSGASLRPSVGGIDAGEAPYADPTDVIVGSGALGGASATVFGKLVGRFVRVAETDIRAAVREIDATSMFVHLPERQFTFELVADLCRIAEERGTPIGFLPLPDDWSAAIGLSLRQAGLAMWPRTYDRAWAIHDGTSTEVAQTIASVTRNVRALVLDVHGNGVDFQLGPQVALCGQEGASAPGRAVAGERYLPCHAGGECVREAGGIRSRVGPDVIRAELVVLASCSAILPHDGFFSARLGVARTLLRGPSVRAVVGGLRALVFPPGIGELIGRALGDGYTAGELAMALNEIAPDAFACMGDPALRVEEVRAGEPSVEDPDERCADDVASGEAELAASPAPSRATLLERLRFAASLPARLVAEECEGAPWRDIASRLEEAASPEPELPPARREWLDPLIATVTAALVRQHGLRLFEPYESTWSDESRTNEMHTCGRPIYVAHPTFPSLGFTRSIWTCERCGIVGNTPLGTSPPRVELLPDHILVNLEAIEGPSVWVVTCLASMGTLLFDATLPLSVPAGDVVKLPRPPGTRGEFPDLVNVALVADGEIWLAHGTG